MVFYRIWRINMIYRLNLGSQRNEQNKKRIDDLKKDFFKGLASNTSTRSTSKDDFQVSHDIPSFLYKQRNLLEKAAYSLRKENKDKDLKTKVSLKGFNLALFVKTKGNPDWVNIENDKVSQLRTTKLEAKEGDPTPPGDVNSLIQSLEKF